ncbi:unnamed protein product [Prorocentrum cordatum]|uniref:Uncharacterized protein n=1 Tax=Prorocentrum cordatum TaxID=2364126 RepID=A0ABN9UX60_9DINO|nr:unnamed protein product [Polarella glacialis]
MAAATAKQDETQQEQFAAQVAIVAIEISAHGFQAPSFLRGASVLQGDPLSSSFCALGTDPPAPGSRAAVAREGAFRHCADDVSIPLWELTATTPTQHLRDLVRRATGWLSFTPCSPATRVFGLSDSIRASLPAFTYAGSMAGLVVAGPMGDAPPLGGARWSRCFRRGEGGGRHCAMSTAPTEYAGSPGAVSLAVGESGLQGELSAGWPQGPAAPRGAALDAALAGVESAAARAALLELRGLLAEEAQQRALSIGRLEREVERLRAVHEETRGSTPGAAGALLSQWAGQELTRLGAAQEKLGHTVESFLESSRRRRWRSKRGLLDDRVSQLDERASAHARHCAELSCRARVRQAAVPPRERATLREGRVGHRRLQRPVPRDRIFTPSKYLS